MGSKRLYQILVGGIIVMVLGLVVGAYFLSSLLQKQSQTLAEQQKQLAVLDGRDTALKQAKKDVERYQGLAKIAKSIVPQDKSQAQTIGEIVKLANANGITLGSFSFPNSTLGDKPSLNATSQLEKIAGIPGVYSLQIIVQSASGSPIPYGNFIHFLQDLEQNRRTAQVGSITITPDSTDPSQVSFSLTLQEYIKP